MYNIFMKDGMITIADIEKLIVDSPALVLYLSRQGCNVCRELKPKIIKLLERDFPKMKFQYIDLDLVKEAPARFSVFAVPTILIFFDGKEFFREGRNLGIIQLSEKLDRPYSLLFR
ncbi:MAG: thioredoxin family protein [Candidatus Aminicenantes bacterium]|nr:thioredoxin family protein [Candidatus Aminicenantes bacterium]